MRFNELSVCSFYHVRILGDRLVDASRGNKKFSTPQNYKTSLRYQANGSEGLVIAYVQILVYQSTNLGRAYIVSGGIGERHIGIVIEAQSTLYLNFTASIYGY